MIHSWYFPLFSFLRLPEGQQIVNIHEGVYPEPTMLSQTILGISLLGAEWVLYFLVFLSILSIAMIIERIRFYGSTSRGLPEFRVQLRAAIAAGRWADAFKLAQDRRTQALAQRRTTDAEAELALAMLSRQGHKLSPEVLGEIAQDAITRVRLNWERNLAILATIGSNAPFVGLFGTVLGIMKAFHDLSQQAGAAAQTVTAGISESLVATAVGLLVAIPAVVAFNFFQRRVKAALLEAEALKSFIIGQMTE